MVGEDLSVIWGGFCAAPTKTHKKLYPKKLLNNLFDNIICCDDDYQLMEWLFEDVNTNMLTDEELREVIFICVMGNDGNDIKFVQNHPELCEMCGWCCKNCNPILVRPHEVPQLPNTNAISLYNNDLFTINVPCIYQKRDNKCGIYENRPESCKTFPIGVKNGSLNVQRDVNCMFIYNFLINKVYFMVNKVYNINNKK